MVDSEVKPSNNKNVPYATTISGAEATVNGIEALSQKNLAVKSLQAYHQDARGKKA